MLFVVEVLETVDGLVVVLDDVLFGPLMVEVVTPVELRLLVDDDVPVFLVVVLPVEGVDEPVEVPATLE